MRPHTVARLALALAAVVLALTRGAHADPARRVYAGIYLHDVTRFNQKDGVFDVDMELWAKWLGEFEPSRLVITNAASVDRTLIAEEHDGAWHSARWRVRGTMRGEFPLHRFPFDAQTLAVTLELPERYGDLVPDLAGSGMRNRFSITGWHYDPEFRPSVAHATYRSDLGSVDTEGRPTTIDRVSFEVVLRRPLLTVALKFFLPLLVILLVAMVALFLPIEKVDARTGIGVTAMLACFAFQFAVADTMPDVAYLTVADDLFMVAYGMTGGLLAESIIAYYLEVHGRKRASRWIDWIARGSVPFAILVSVLSLARSEAPPPVVHAPAAAPAPRHASARAVLRVALTQPLNAVNAGILARGTARGCGHRTADGTAQRGLCEELPSISNDALHFLAGGSIEVHWRLRPGLRWSDGAPLTSSDLAFSERTVPEPHTLGYSTPDAQTLVIRYDDRVATLLEDYIPTPQHAVASVFAHGGYDALRDYRRTHPVPTAGPYRIAEFVSGHRAVLEPNPYFDGPPPAIRRIEVTQYADGDAAIRAFEAGQLDLIVPNAVTPEQANALAARRPDAVHLRASELLTELHPDLGVPVLARLDVRRALLMAIDREAVRGALFGDGGRVADVPAPGDPPPGTVITRHDPDAARTILHAAGADAVHLPLIISNSSPLDRIVAAHVAQDLAAVGVETEIREVNNITELFRTRHHGGLLIRTYAAARDDSPFVYFAIPVAGGRYVHATRTPAYDDATAELVEREERALYPERRDQLRERLLVTASERLPFLLLYFGVERVVVDPHLVGWDAAHGAHFAENVDDWYFDAP